MWICIVQNFRQKDLTQVKIFQKVSGGYFLLKHPVYKFFTYLLTYRCMWYKT